MGWAVLWCLITSMWVFIMGWYIWGDDFVRCLYPRRRTVGFDHEDEITDLPDMIDLQNELAAKIRHLAEVEADPTSMVEKKRKIIEQRFKKSTEYELSSWGFDISRELKRMRAEQATVTPETVIKAARLEVDVVMGKLITTWLS